MDITLDPDAAPDPAYLLDVAWAFAESVRVMGRLTRHMEAFGDPADAARCLREISAGLAALPQVATQASRWLALEHSASRIRVTHGEYAHRPVAAVNSFWEHLDDAREALAAAAAGLGGAAEIASALAPREDGRA